MSKPPRLPPSQLELGIEREKENDRNFHLGGRSFYFFDFDDNIAFLTTPLVLFHKDHGGELEVSTGAFAREQASIGKAGAYKDHVIRWDDKTGTFRNFRDHDDAELKRLGKNGQIFLGDVAHALGLPDFDWKGPSWECFYHAVFNQRPISVITARGHHPDTIKSGIRLFCDAGHLPEHPNFLSVFPVNHVETRRLLGDAEAKLSVAELKQAAIRVSVEIAIQQYGYSKHHRFGMSDDDPKNIQLIVDEMKRLKVTYPEFSFFVIETHGGSFTKYEVFPEGRRRSSGGGDPDQGQLF